jgi:hypothetical protein
VKYLKAYKISLRTEDDARKLRKSNLAYGERWQDGKVVPCKREQENIVMIKKLRAQGMGLQGIADFLNSMEIPTKTRKGKWQTAQVWYILNR